MLLDLLRQIHHINQSQKGTYMSFSIRFYSLDNVFSFVELFGLDALNNLLSMKSRHSIKQGFVYLDQFIELNTHNQRITLLGFNDGNSEIMEELLIPISSEGDILWNEMEVVTNGSYNNDSRKATKEELKPYISRINQIAKAQAHGRLINNRRFNRVD